MDTKERFAKAIKFTGLKKKEFAKIVNVTPNHISRILKGGCNPSIQLCENVQSKFGISSQWLMQGEGKMINEVTQTVSQRNKGVAEFVGKALDDIGGDIYGLLDDLSKLSKDDLKIIEVICDSLVKSKKQRG